MIKMIPVNTPLLNGNEKKYLEECIETGWISSEGPFVKKFEDKMAAYLERKYATACSNGSAALDIAIQALRLNEGDEIIMPTFTIISCAQSITRYGLTPIVVDCDERTFNMKVEDVEEKISSKTKAIMIVHLYGITVDLDPILELAKKYKLKVIEDAAQMIGQEYKGKKCGSFGDISTLSFYPNKHITTGEGGMVLTNDQELDERAKSIRNLCFGKDRFIHHEIGFNYRLTNIQAAIGLAQFEKIDSTIIRKREIGELYNKLLSDIECVDLPIKSTNYCENIYWVYPILLKPSAKKTAKEVMEILASLNIGTRPFFYPIHRQPVYLNLGMFKDENCPVAESIYEYGFYIPSGVGLTDDEIHFVSKKLHEVLI